jgi:hypothetical protein
MVAESTCLLVGDFSSIVADQGTEIQSVWKIDQFRCPYLHGFGCRERSLPHLAFVASSYLCICAKTVRCR